MRTLLKLLIQAVTQTGLVLGSGILFGLTFPAPAMRGLAWVAFVPFMVAIQRASLGGSLVLGGLCALFHAYFTGTWFSRTIAGYYGQPEVVGTISFLLMAATMVAPYYMVFAVAYRSLAMRYRAALPFLAAAAWVTAELGRGRLFTGTPLFIGNPWALLGYSQVGHHTLTQIASVTGVYGITFAIAVVNAALADLCLVLWYRDRSLWKAIRGVVVAAIPAIAILGFGYLSLREAPPVDAQPPGTPVAIVQGNIDSGARWRSDLYGRNLEIYLRLTRSQLQTGAAEIIFWPEAAMTFFLADEPLYRSAISRVLGSNGPQLVAGGPFAFRGEDDTPRYFNSVFLMSPEGQILERYDKQYLVPFAEYFPLAGVDPIRRRFERVRVFTHGKEPRLLPTRAGKAGVVICNEAMLPEVVSERVAQGASFLINPSNDTWIGEPTFVGLQFDIISLRAVEQRRYLVRSSTSGPSAVIDPWGRVLAKTQPGVRKAIQGSIRARSDRSVYSRLGDLFAFLCLALVILSLLVRPWRDPLERRHLWGRAGSSPATR